MSVLQIIYGLDEIFSKHAEAVTEFNEDLSILANNMLDTLSHEHALGIGANMIGVLKRIIVIDLQREGKKNPYIMVNPEILDSSKEISEYDEGSLSFPGIKIKVKRPEKITVRYQDLKGEYKELIADDLLARVIQHEIDYLNAKTIFDHASKLKRDVAIKKMNKNLKEHPPHIHSSSCNH